MLSNDHAHSPAAPATMCPAAASLAPALGHKVPRDAASCRGLNIPSSKDAPVVGHNIPRDAASISSCDDKRTTTCCCCFWLTFLSSSHASCAKETGWVAPRPACTYKRVHSASPLPLVATYTAPPGSAFPLPCLHYPVQLSILAPQEA